MNKKFISIIFLMSVVLALIVCAVMNKYNLPALIGLSMIISILLAVIVGFIFTK